ncbi:unnamed protein product [Moneuplotes crassus]|uniref:Uncharacterized protein n=1 Tax=Euplotes crassus TaxID=5936 RepID=A0AAD2D5P6_EUPCR|nr:unnamed protein product [Moneuplotes crassus]
MATAMSAVVEAGLAGGLYGERLVGDRLVGGGLYDGYYNGLGGYYGAHEAYGAYGAPVIGAGVVGERVVAAPAVAAGVVGERVVGAGLYDGLYGGYGPYYGEAYGAYGAYGAPVVGGAVVADGYVGRPRFV